MMRAPYNTIPEGSVKPDNPTGNPDMLEERIHAVLGWAQALMHIGTCRDVQGDAIAVIGAALDDLAGCMADDYRALHRKHGGAL